MHASNPKRLTFSVIFALLTPAAAYSQAAFLPLPSSINLVGQPITEQVGSYIQINSFSATVNYTSGDPQWLCLTAFATSISSETVLTGLATPAAFSVSVGGCPGQALGSNFTGAHTAGIVLQATDGSGAPNLTLPVTYTAGSGGGNYTVTASVSSIVQNITFGGQTTVSFDLNTSSPTPISYTLANPPVSWVSWYLVAGDPSVSSTSAAVIAVFLNGAGQPEGSLTTTLTVDTGNGNVSIPVTLNNGASGGGGGGSGGGLTVSPTSISWSYSEAAPNVFPSSTTVGLSSKNGAITYTANVANSPGWLLVNNNAATATGTVGTTPLIVSPNNANLAALAPGTYTANVTITGSDGSTGTITVTATVTETGTASGAISMLPSLTTINLVGQTVATETVISSTSAPITFNATISYPVSGDTSWLCIDGTNPGTSESVSGAITPESFVLDVCGAPSIFYTTHTANITLVATDSSGAANVTIPVFYTLGAGGGALGGSGPITAAPPSITTPSFLTAYSTSVTLQTTSSSPVYFSLSTSPSVSWVTGLTANTYAISSGKPATVTITMNGAGNAAGALTTTLVVSSPFLEALNIPITFYNQAAAAGGGSTGSISVSQTSVPWSYSASNPSLFPGSVTVTPSSTSGDVAYTATATSSNGWLLINGGYTTGGTAGVTSITLSATSQIAALTPGTYSGTVTITEADNGDVATIAVTATVTGANSSLLTIAPNPIQISAVAGGAIASTSVTVTSALSGTLTLIPSCSGISLSTNSTTVNGGIPISVTLLGSPAGLAAGTYIGSLIASVGGLSSSAEITFVLGAGSGGGTTIGGGGTTIAAAPSQLNFYYEQSHTATSQSQQVYLSGSGNYTVTSSTANSSVNWLSSSTTSGVLPSTISIAANAAGMASGTYTGQITIDNTSTGVTSVVSVTMLIEGITTIYAIPGDAVFNYISNTSSSSQSQQITIASSDGSAVSVAASVTNSSATPWLNVTGGGTTPVGLDVTANASSLANGIYTGSIAVTGGNNTLTIPIALVVTGSSVSAGSGPLTLGSASLALQAQVNGSPVSQTLSVSASAATTFSINPSGAYNGITWLSVSPSGSTTTPTSIVVSANPASLPAGNYSGAISLLANGVAQSAQVSFTVGATSGSASTISVTANGGSSTSPSLTFTAASPGASVSSQYISVTSPAGQSSAAFTVSATTTSGGNWISLSTSAGTQYTTPVSAIAVSVATTGLAGGMYNGQITITPAGGTAISVPVTLTIAGSPAIAVSTTSLSFAYQAGSATPNTQSIPVTVSNGTSANVTATAASNPGGWLGVTPASGTAPSSLTVSIVPTGLAAGVYTGTITVAGSSGPTGSATVKVTLTVTAPAPTITTVVNAASFLNEPVSPGEMIVIGGTDIGPAAAASFTLSGNLVPTALGGVQVLVSGYAAPILYVSATQINAVVPYEIAGLLNPTVQVQFLGQSSNLYTVNAAATAPGIFTANGSGTGPGAIFNSDNSSNVGSAAARGTVVQVFLTGEGQTSPAGVDGEVTAGPYPPPLLPITITVGGAPANYEFAGEAPGLVAGTLQLNVIIPPTLTVTGNVPLVVTIGSASTQAGVTVNIR